MNKFITIENQYLKLIISSLGAGIYQAYLKSDTLIPVLITNQHEDDYLVSTNYYGKTIGRFAGRLFGPDYILNNNKYTVECNPKSSFMLHGGSKGDWSQVFSVSKLGTDHITLSHQSEATVTFPGVLTLEVSYKLIEKTIRIDYFAKSTEDTLCNITNHAYFNLNIEQGSILDHELFLNAPKYNVLDDSYAFIKQTQTKDTPFDFNTSKPLRKGVMSLLNTAQKGLDHCFITATNYVGSLYEPLSKRRLNVYSDYPSVVIYTHNFESRKPLNAKTKNGVHSSITFECQYEPDGIHHDGLHKAILKKDDTYQHYIEYQFEF